MKATSQAVAGDRAAVSAVSAASTDKRRAFQSLWVLGSIGLLYISFGISFGLLEFAVPPILLSQGVDLAKMGWVIALYIPFGLTFLWAPLIDAKPLPWLSYRIGWIVIAQWLSAALLIIIAFGSHLPAAWLFGLGFAVCFAVATMDLALDALAVDIVSKHHLSSVAALKVGALALGGMLGGGVFLGLYSHLHWKGIFLLSALIPIISALPVVALTKADRPRPTHSTRPSILMALKRPDLVGQLVLLALLTTTVIGLVYFQRVILVEMHVSLAHIGWTIGTLSPIFNAVAAALVTPILYRFRAGKIFWLLIAGCVLTNVGVLYGIAHHSAIVVTSWSLVGASVCSALSVMIYTLILRWAEGTQAATDYALLCGGSRLIATLVLMGIPSILPTIGWRGFYIASSIALVVLGAFAYRHIERVAKENAALVPNA